MEGVGIKEKKRKKLFQDIFHPQQTLLACGVSAVKPDDKNVYSRAVIKERVSQSKVSITQYPWLSYHSYHLHTGVFQFIFIVAVERFKYIK